MPPSAKTEKDNLGEGFPAYNPSRRRETPPELKKPVPHYRHLVRWNDKQPVASLEERQMNHDLVVLRHALDLFLDLKMTESEALLMRGPQPVSADETTVPDYASVYPTAAQSASKAARNKDNETSLAEDDQKSSNCEEEDDSTSLSTEAQEKLSLGSSGESEKKGKGSKETRSMYYDLGRSIIQGMRAIATFDPDEIAMGMKLFEQTIKTADKQRKGSMLGMGSVKAVGSFVVGSIGAGSFKSMTRVQKHAELIFAEATILRAGLSVFYHMDLWMVLEEAINLRSAFTIIQGLKSFMDSVESELRAGKNIDHYQIDEHLVSGVTLSYSLYNIIISFLPDVIIKMLQFIGFPSDRDWGMAMLAACGDWDPSAAAAESPEEHQERLSSSANEGIRRQFCDMVPVIYHIIVSSFIPMKHVDFAYAKRINDYNLGLYPDSPFFIFFKGRHLQVSSKLDEAIATYRSVKAVGPRWHNFTHILVFEELMCAMMQADHDTACEKSRQLLKESRWSKCCYRYLTAITGLERGKSSEKKKINALMDKVEDGMQKIAGVNLFFETFCARKAKRYAKEGHLLLPSFDFMILWNSFDMMPPKSLKRALDIISDEVRRLKQLLPSKMKERESRPLAAKDQTIEAATGGYLSGMFSSKNASAKESKVGSYENFYDDYCLAHFLQGVVAYHLAFFPEEPFDAEMCALALESFDTVFRYAPLINDDTYTYYFSHYYKAKIWIHQGRLEEAEVRFKYLLGLTNTSVLGLPALLGGKGRNSLEVFLLLKTHSGQLDLEAAKTSADSGSVNSGK
ncbi:hypothetical protein KVV02_008340 [Mortierella alpina]|uniref:Inclusion body clearance protein IML2 n=1 Tax=Mortierella alpina TaxID=64518 RepID=A0A9P8A1A8_MORAP|nr:hypothetical protein KVV02_008340 [Mortierella alpina]